MNGSSHKIVVTAAHCVHKGPHQGFVSNWIFEPGYDNGASAVGIFPGVTFGVRTGWTEDGDESRDYSFVITGPNASGQNVADAVGANGLHFNGDYPNVHTIGYPDNIDSARTQQICDTSTTRDSLFSNHIQANCRMRHGASGGPWLETFSNTSGLGTVITVTTGARDSEPSHIFGPRFDDDALGLFRAANSRA